jgi:mannitol/fructose-specific phosphotransferase system IIA component
MPSPIKIAVPHPFVYAVSFEASVLSAFRGRKILIPHPIQHRLLIEVSKVRFL